VKRQAEAFNFDFAGSWYYSVIRMQCSSYCNYFCQST